MKIEDIKNLTAIEILESCTELLKVKKYQNKDFVEKYIGLVLSRIGFYGLDKIPLTPLPLSRTNFNSEQDIVIRIEGIIVLKNAPTNEGLGDIVYKGYGLLEANETVIYDGRGGAGGGEAEDVTYSKVAETTVGGITAGDIVGPTQKDFNDALLSPPYVVPTFSSFTLVIPNLELELGEKLETPKTFTWNYTTEPNVTDNTIEIRQGATVLATSLAKSPTTLVGQAITPVLNNIATTETFSIRGDHEKGTIATRNANVSWLGSVYYGVALDVPNSSINEAWIKANLTRSLNNSHLSSVTGNIGVGERLYYIYPIAYGLRLFDTPLGSEGGSLIIVAGPSVRTDSQIANSLLAVDYAVNKNEQSNIGNITYTLTTL